MNTEAGLGKAYLLRDVRVRFVPARELEAHRRLFAGRLGDIALQVPRCLQLVAQTVVAARRSSARMAVDMPCRCWGRYCWL